MLKVKLTWETYMGTTGHPKPIEFGVQQILTKKEFDFGHDPKGLFMEMASKMYDDLMRNVELMS